MNKIIKRLIQIIFIFIITLLITGHSNAVDEITSNYYKIDSAKNIISRIEPETTIEVFKSKITGNNIQIFQDKSCTNEITSGNVGTNHLLKNGERIYKLSVVGDFDGDGKAIQTELTNIIRYIVGLQDSELKGIYYESADLTGDGLVDQRDITKYINYIVHGELDLGKKDETAPEVEIKVLEKSTNKIKIKSIGTDRETGIDSNVIYTYYIKKASEPDTAYVKKHSSTEEEFEFDNLESNQTYTIKAEIPDRAGNVGKTELDVKTEAIPNPNTQQGAITFGNVEWNNGNASVKISTNTSYIIEYQVGSVAGIWTKGTTVGSDVTVSNLEHNDVIYSRLTDGTNVGSYITLTITDDIDPIVTITTENTTSEITATVLATDNESGIATTSTYKFYIKKSNEPDTAYVLKQDTTDKTYKFTGLTANETYIIKVVVKDIAGNQGVQTKQIMMTNIPDADTQQGAITFGNVTWSNGKASVKISTNTSYIIEYKVGSVVRTWIKGTSAGADVTVSNLEHNDVIYARLTDGTNAGGYKTLTILDTTDSIVTITTENTTSEITTTVSATDNESGISSTAIYAFYIKKSSESDAAYVQKQNTTSNEYSFTGLTANEEYTIKVVVKDIAGNEGVGTADVITNGMPNADPEDGTITFADPTWSDGKASITISTNTNYIIEYQVNSYTGNWTKAESAGANVIVSNLSHNNEVYARLTDGINAGNHTVVKIADTTVPENATITLSATSATTETSITAQITLTDNQTGVNITNSKWVYTKTSTALGTNSSSYTNSFATNSETLTLNTTTEGTYYLHILTEDNAGNKKETISNAITVKSVAVGAFVKYDAGEWTQEEIAELQSKSLYNINISKEVSSQTGLNFTFGGFSYSGDTTNASYINDGTIITSRNQSVSCFLWSEETTPSNEGWLILECEERDGKTYVTKLVHAGAPENFVYYDDEPGYAFRAEYILSNGARKTEYDTYQPRNWDMYKDQSQLNLIEEVHAMTYDEFTGVTNPLNRTRNTGAYHWLASTVADSFYGYIFYGGWKNGSLGINPCSGQVNYTSSYCWGVRPVVTLKSGVYIESGEGTENNPYVLGTEGFSDVELEEATITFGDLSWSDGKASITISTNTDYTIEYQVNSYTGNWTKAESAGANVIVSNLSHNNEVYARLTDGTNVGNYASLTIADETEPEDATIILSATTVEVGTSITATVSHIDNESGIDISKCKWVLNTNSSYIGTDSNYYTGGTFRSNNEQISFSPTSEGSYYLHVLSVDKAGNKKETISQVIKVQSVSIKIGDIVNYTPSGTYVWDERYSTDDSTSRVTLNSSTEEFKVSQWKVMDIDYSTEKVKLVPANPGTFESAGKVRIGGAQGYNNGVYLLNEACKNLYGNIQKGIEARSITIEDIIEQMTDEALEYAYEDTSGGWAKYGEQLTSANIKDKSYPIMYAKEMLSVIDGNKKESGLNVSEQTALIEKTDDGATNGFKTATNSIQPFDTRIGRFNFYGSYFKESDKMQSMLIELGSKEYEYWIASRYVGYGYSLAYSEDSEVWDFGLLCIDDGMMDFRDTFDCTGESSYAWRLPIEPVVTMDTSLLTLQEKYWNSSAWDVNV